MKVVFCETKFVTNEKKRTVTCVMTVRVSPENEQNVFQPNYYNSKTLEPFTVIGISKCHESDEFNQKTGEKIAESRAKLKAYEEGTSRIKEIKKAAETIIRNIQYQSDKLKEFSNIEKDHLKSLII